MSPHERRHALSFRWSFRVGDVIVDDGGEWQVVSRPYTVVAGKRVVARVRKVGESANVVERSWGAHERVDVRP